MTNWRKIGRETTDQQDRLSIHETVLFDREVSNWLDNDKQFGTIFPQKIRSIDWRVKFREEMKGFWDRWEGKKDSQSTRETVHPSEKLMIDGMQRLVIAERHEQF